MEAIYNNAVISVKAGVNFAKSNRVFAVRGKNEESKTARFNWLVGSSVK